MMDFEERLYRAAGPDIGSDPRALDQMEPPWLRERETVVRWDMSSWLAESLRVLAHWLGQHLHHPPMSARPS